MGMLGKAIYNVVKEIMYELFISVVHRNHNIIFLGI